MARTDDPSIADEDALWRRILAHRGWIVRASNGGFRPSSVAFLDNLNGEVSVHVARLTTKDLVLADYPDQSLAEILAHVPRSLGHVVAFDKKPNDLSHAVICPPPQIPNKRRKRDAREMAERARWILLQPQS